MPARVGPVLPRAGQLPRPAGILAKVAASGAFASLSTTKLLTAEEMRTALHGAGGVGYRPPGAAI